MEREVNEEMRSMRHGQGTHGSAVDKMQCLWRGGVSTLEGGPGL